MQMCMDHWNALRAAIDARGLSALVSESGEQAAANLASEMQDGPSVDNFDPLLGAHNAIMVHALEHGGFGVMQPNADGSERCPLCWMNSMHNEHCREPGCIETAVYDRWIDLAADGQVEDWKALRD